ncbi:MAG: leucine-rich repeat domain-containing protein [Kosmotogaceae bacterium]
MTFNSELKVEFRVKYIMILIIIIILSLSIETCTTSVGPNNSKKPTAVLTSTASVVKVGNYIILDGSQSSTGGSDTLIYNWEADESNPVEVPLYGEKTQNLGFIKEGTYIFRLTVSDGTQNSNTEQVEIKVEPRTNIIFEDPSLEIQVRYALKMPTDELIGEDLLKVDSLSRKIITGVDIYSLNGLENCENIVYLQFGHQNISNITPLSALTKLRELNLTQNRKIKDITPLRNLVSLEKLKLDRNLIEDISALQNLIKLTYLNMLENPIQDLSYLKNLTKLEELWLSYTQDGELLFLTELKNLYLLWMTSCNVTDIQYLKSPTNLHKINFDGNDITDLSPLSNLKQLEWLYLDQNQVTDITPLESLENLTALRLWNNQITDILPLVNNKGLGEGDEVGLFGNPLNEISINKYIPALRARGVVVWW